MTLEYSDSITVCFIKLRRIYIDRNLSSEGSAGKMKNYYLSKRPPLSKALCQALNIYCCI